MTEEIIGEKSSFTFYVFAYDSLIADNTNV